MMSDMAGKSRRTPEQIAAFRTTIESGGTLEQAKLAAGHTASVAKLGKRGLSKDLTSALADIERGKAKEIIAIGRALRNNLDEAKDLVFGRFGHNVMTGSDAGAMSAKSLAGLRGVDLNTPETMIGIQVNNLPAGLDTLITRRIADDSGQP
jgi:hypothetical protein